MSKNKSIRLQMRDLKEKLPQDFESHDYVVVRFVEEGRYAVTHYKYVVGDISHRAEVTVKCGSAKSYPATIIYIGSEDACKKKVDLLTRDVGEAAGMSEIPKSQSKSNKTKGDNIDKEVQKELQRVKQFEISDTENDNIYSDEDDDNGSVGFKKQDNHTEKHICDRLSVKIDLILEKVKTIESALVHTKHGGKQADEFMTFEQTPPPKKMNNSTNLLSLASDSGNPKKYGFNVFKSVYDDEEMVNHAMEPSPSMKSE